MDRRKFLKYAGMTAAVVGASGLGLNFVSQRSPSMMSPTTSTTLVPRLTTTSVSLSTSTESVQLTSLRGRLFFDYNGNGKQDAGEPAVAGALVQLKDTTGNTIAQALTDSSGDYRLEDVRTGLYKLHLGVEHFSDKQFTYMCTSPNEVKAMTEDYDLSLQENVNLDIGLMEGFLTQPVSSKTHFSSSRLLYDWDPTPETSLWWNGIAGRDPNNHAGHDYDVPDNQPVLAAAPGNVVFVGDNPAGKGIVIEHYAYSLDGFHRFFTVYWHLSQFEVGAGQLVPRGQIIARSGHTGVNQHPHLHFALDRDATGPGSKILDPYCPAFDVKPVDNGYWTNDPSNQYYGYAWIPWTSKETNPNVLNYWTKKNSPQFPANQQG